MRKRILELIDLYQIEIIELEKKIKKGNLTDEEFNACLFSINKNKSFIDNLNNLLKDIIKYKDKIKPKKKK